MIVEAFAKINWSLDITGVLENGYHLMDMLMQPVSLADEITLRPAEDITLTTGGFPLLRADPDNLAWRAAAALRERTGTSLGAAIHVEKRIPVGAGLGGGSADAAAVLRGLNRLWGAGLSEAELEETGLALGADVPFCLRGGLTRTRGIGEQLEELPCRCNWWLILIQPCRGLSTGEVFSAWHADAAPERPDTESAIRALETGDLPLLSRSLRNVLQPVSVRMRPAIGEAIRALRERGAAAALMTGSGSAVFGVFPSGKLARAAFPPLRQRWGATFLCHSQSDSARITEE